MYTLTASCCASKAHDLSRNIVATVNLDCRLDLKTIALHARNAEYNPKVLLTPGLCYTSPSRANLSSVLPLSSCASVTPRLPL